MRYFNLRENTMRTIVLPGVITILLLFTFTLSGEETESEIKILRVGSFHGDEVNASSGEVWFGLYQVDDRFELIRSEISVEQVYDPIRDADDSAGTGKKISVDYPTDPLFLVKGLEDLKEGTVKAAFSGRKFIYPGETLSFEFEEGDYYAMAAFGEVADAGIARPFHIKYRDYQIKFSHTPWANTQLIASFASLSIDRLPELLWAGDLDRDGKLDLLFDLTSHYNVQLYSLFLSSAAEEDELVKLVSQFRNVGC